MTEITNHTTIVRQLLKKVLFLTLGLTLLFTAIQAVIEYRKELDSLQKNLEELQYTQVQGISAALWGFDKQTIASQLEGILHFPYLNYAAVRGKDGFVVETGKKNFDDYIDRETPLTHDYNGRSILLGTLYLQADTSRAIHQVAGKVLIIFLFQLINVVIVSTFIFLLFNRLVTRYISQAAEHFRAFDLNRMSKPLTLDKRTNNDEIDTLVNAFNLMQEKLARTYQQLSEREERYRALAESTSAISWEFDMVSDRWTYVAPQAERILGYAPEEWKDLAWWVDRLHPEDREWASSFCRKMAAAGETYSFEYRLVTKEGKTVWINDFVNVEMQDNQPVIMRGILVDTTERKHLEEKLQQSLKMESIGRLAGGVAHDFNNMLTVILGYAEMAKHHLPVEDKLWQTFDEITKAAEHSRKITGQLLAFSRQQIISPKPIDLNLALMKSRKSLPHLIGEDIILTFSLPDNLWPVKIDPTQLDQIILNLAVNARDAMPDGGELRVSTSNIRIDEYYCHDHLEAKPGEYVQLTFTDTGHGMDAETVKNIFEPFFTTKEVGKGTGLGLATIYGIVTQNNGFINVYSEPGQGSVFKIFLPHMQEAPTLEPKEIPTPVEGSGTILLVEDDETVRKMTTEMLELIGYDVRAVQSSSEAIELCADKNVHVDIVLSDVIMPKLNGQEMMESIKSLRPGIKALFMSGYSSEIISQKGVLEEKVHFLQKPFDVTRLASKIKEALSEA